MLLDVSARKTSGSFTIICIYDQIAPISMSLKAQN